MVSKATIITQSPIFNVLIAQCLATVLVSILCLVFGKETGISFISALSAMMAGVVCVVPGIYVLLISLRQVKSSGVANILRGEIGKFALSISLFALVFVFFEELRVLVFFGTCVGLQLLHALVPFYLSAKLVKNHL